MASFKLRYVFIKFELKNVFTPTTYAGLTYINRPELRKQIERYILQTGMQMVVYGHSGSGKSTLINNFLQSKKIKHITSRVMKGTTYKDLVLDAFDKLNIYYTDEKSTKKSIKITNSLLQTYNNLKNTISSEFTTEEGQKSIRALPVQLTPQRLGEFLGAAECLWIIEDFHKIDEDEKVHLVQTMKMFMDLSNQFESLKIICLGARSSAREVIEIDSEMINRVAEVHVPLLEQGQLKKIVKKGNELLNVELDGESEEKIAYYSNSLASITHQLCYNYCSNKGIFESKAHSRKVTDSDINEAIKDTIQQNSDTFERIYSIATRQEKGKYENVKAIFDAMIKLNQDSYSHNEILHEIQKTYPEYPSGNLSTYLKNLISSKYEEVLFFDEDSGKYSFTNPFFQAYVMMKFNSHEKVVRNLEIDEVDYEKFMAFLSQIVNKDKEMASR